MISAVLPDESAAGPEISAARKRPPIYRNLTAQVVTAICLGIVTGHTFPEFAAALKPLGDAFVRAIRMVIGPIVFITVSTGIAGIGDVKKVGRLGLKIIVYFEIVSTLALAIGMLVGNLIQLGAGFVRPADNTLPKAAVKAQPLAHSLTDLLFAIIPDNIFAAFVQLDVMQILFFAVLFGFGLIAVGDRAKAVSAFLDGVARVLFAIIAIVVKAAPIAAFGAMAFTVGTFGLGSLSSLLKLVLEVYATILIFIIVVLGSICRLYGFRLFRFLSYIREEIFITIGTSNSESVMPRLMDKLGKFGCNPGVVGLVIPAGYSLNLDGAAIYLSLSALFIAQVYGIDLSIWQQLSLLALMMFTSKGLGGVAGAGYIILMSTVTATGFLPIEGMALMLGIERFMSEARAVGNLIGNAVATIVIARAEGEFDELAALEQYRAHFNDGRMSRL